MAKRKVAAAEAVPFTSTEEPAPQVTETVTPTPTAEEGQRPLERLPEIREMKSINLGPDRDSPRLRLLRNYRFNQIQIRSDEELPQAAREQLQAAGWKDRTEEEGIWTKQLPPRRARTRSTKSRRSPAGRRSSRPSACSMTSPTRSAPTRACRRSARNGEPGRRSDRQATTQRHRVSKATEQTGRG